MSFLTRYNESISNRQKCQLGKSIREVVENSKKLMILFLLVEKN